MSTPKTVLEWIDLIHGILQKNDDGKQVIEKLTRVYRSRNAMEHFGPLGGMWVRNSTHLWTPGVADDIAADVIDLRRRYPIELLDDGTILDTNEDPPNGIDCRLTHPDNLSWVLVMLYSDWLKGVLKLTHLMPDYSLSDNITR